MVNRVPVRAVLLAILVFLSGFAEAQIADINSAINKAGRERMLSQRVAKAYFQIGLGVDVDRSKNILDASIALFDRHLVELKNYAPTPEIKETYQKLEKSWLSYKDALVGAAPNPATGKKVLDLSEEVLHLAQQGAMQLEKYSGTSTSHLVNVAGRQRMLSQRMAKFYQAAAWKIGGAQISPEVQRARVEFSGILKELISAPNNAQALRDELDLVKQQWMFFENALNQPAGSDKTLSTNVATTSERILQTMENVVSLYEKASK